MSLVAYGASDDSETSDAEEAEVLQVVKSGDANDLAFADDGKISDEEDYIPTVSCQRAASSTTETGFQSVPAPSSLSDLPAPKPIPLSSSHGEGQGDGEDELEDAVKPKASQLADAPKPPPKKSKQPARIVIPALKQDSDEEDDNSKKKTKQAAATSGSGSGLFALLPPPVHSSRKQTNRPLIPYTLTKRPTPSKPTTTTTSSTTPTSSRTAVTDLLPSKKHQSAFNALTGYESDSDEEESGPTSGSVDFFTLGSKASGVPTVSEVSVVKNSAQSVDEEGRGTARTSDSGNDLSSEKPDVQSSSSLQSSPTHASLRKSDSPVSSSSVSSSGKVDSVTVSTVAETIQDSPTADDEGSGENEVTSTVGIPQFNQDAPLAFNSSTQSLGWSTTPLVSPMLPEMYAAPSSSSAASYWQRQQHYAQDYAAETQQEVESGPGSSSGSNIQEYMEDEQFLRISGKRKRGQEDIQIIDANVDDYVDPSDLMKGISEESSYQPHRKKDNMPSTQQRRKKQITYLAFQAKERELELKNAWSQNRMTKNQARSKYGF